MGDGQRVVVNPDAESPQADPSTAYVEASIVFLSSQGRTRSAFNVVDVIGATNISQPLDFWRYGYSLCLHDPRAL